MNTLEKIQKILEVAGVNAEVVQSSESDNTQEIYEIDGMVMVSHFPGESPEWEAGYLERIPGTRWEPEDVDYVSVYKGSSFITAVTEAISTLIQLKLNDVHEAIYTPEELGYV